MVFATTLTYSLAIIVKREMMAIRECRCSYRLWRMYIMTSKDRHNDPAHSIHPHHGLLLLLQECELWQHKAKEQRIAETANSKR